MLTTDALKFWLGMILPRMWEGGLGLWSHATTTQWTPAVGMLLTHLRTGSFCVSAEAQKEEGWGGGVIRSVSFGPLLVGAESGGGCDLSPRHTFSIFCPPFT